MREIEDFNKDPLIDGLLKSESYLRILDAQALQVVFENPGLKQKRITSNTSLLAEANRLKAIDFNKRHYLKTSPTFSGCVVRAENLYRDSEIQEEDFNPRIFKLFEDKNINPIYVACQKESRASEISIFEYEPGFKDYCLTDFCRQFVGKIEFNVTGLKYFLVDSGLSQSQLNILPENSFMLKKTLLEAEFETRFFIDKPSYFDVRIFQNENTFAFTNVRPTWNETTECYELHFFE